MRTTYCIPTLKKVKPYDLHVEDVKIHKYKNPYIIRAEKNDAESIEKAYSEAVNLSADAVKENDCIVIELLNGEYRFKDTMRLDKRTNSNLPIVFRSLGKTSLFGSVRLCGGWEAYKNGIYKAHVESDKFRQLYVNGKMAVRGRFPKKNDDCAKEVFEGKWLDKTKQILLPHEFDDAMKGFNPETTEIHIIEAWTHSVIKPGTFTSEEKGIVVDLAEICRDRFYEPRSSKIPKPKVWLENELSLLSEPNEWYYDFENKDLYYYPEDGNKINELVFEIPQTETIFEINGCSNIRFENIEFAYTNWKSPSEIGYVDGQGVSRLDTIDGVTAWRTPPAALNILSSDSIHFVGCTVHGTGGMGVKYDGASNDILLYRNHFYEIGAGAISAGSFIVEDPFKSPVSKGVVICDNVINKFGQSYLSGVGILVGYSQDVVIDHNDVSYGSYTGISVGWGWGLETPMCGCKIRNNRVTHIIENHLYDGSGLYILGRHLMDKKNIVSGNYLEGGHGYAGLYFDEKADNYIAKNNYIGRGRKWFLLMHDIDYGLHDISVEDNFIEITRKYMNSYSPGHAFKPKTKKRRNISIHGNISPINPYWKENKQRIYDNSGVRKV